jgi:hypothetical protein
MGCLAIKAMAKSPWPKGAKKTYPKCWYQPASDAEEAALALRFTLSEQVTAAIPPGDEQLFRMTLDIAPGFEPLTDSERENLRQRADGVKPIFRLAEG